MNYIVYFLQDDLFIVIFFEPTSITYFIQNQKGELLVIVNMKFLQKDCFVNLWAN